MSLYRPPTAPVPLQWLWRQSLRLRFWLSQRHRHDRLVIERVGGQPLVILPQVLNPKLFRSGEFLATRLDDGLIPPGATVLDMGTGSGIGAIFAARRAARVLAVDINHEAVRCARINALLAGVEARVEVREGDLFEPVGDERFDVILFNPPFYDGVPRDPLEHAFRGRDVVARFARGLGTRLAPGGHAVVLLSSDGDIDAQLAQFRRHGFAMTVHDESRSPGETLVLLTLRPIAPQQ